MERGREGREEERGRESEQTHKQERDEQSIMLNGHYTLDH